MENNKSYPNSELVLNSRGAVYHLDLLPEEIANTIILVGDQNRVRKVSNFFDHIELSRQHREFCTTTGSYRGLRISVISTGIGTDNVDIVVNELDALANIDLITRKDLESCRSLELIRIGTCGILHGDIPVHSYILSTGAIGLDNVAHYYQIPFSQEEIKMAEAFKNNILLDLRIDPYFKFASEKLVEKFAPKDQLYQGITLTSSGFYGPQGRQLRLLKSSIWSNLVENSVLNDHPILNFEMESSALFALGKALGHEVATICLGVGNRSTKEFSEGYEIEMNQLIEYTLKCLTSN